MQNLTINGYDLIYIPWNIILLIIPFFLVFLNVKIKKSSNNKHIKKVSTALIFLFWLLFVPNTAYVIVDSRHMIHSCFLSDRHLCLKNSWYIMFFFAYGLVGWVGTVYAIEQMKNFIALSHKSLARFFPIFLIPLISLGVLMGLVGRLNSWDVFTKPDKLIVFFDMYMLNFVFLKNFIIFTLFYFIFYYSGSFLFKSLFFVRMGKNKKMN